MDCLPVNDVCHLEQAFEARTEQVVLRSGYESRWISLGTFNGRAYSYNWYGDKPFILVYDLAANTPFPSNTLEGN